jgi:hypothetical protein
MIINRLTTLIINLSLLIFIFQSHITCPPSLKLIYGPFTEENYQEMNNTLVEVEKILKRRVRSKIYYRLV